MNNSHEMIIIKAFTAAITRIQCYYLYITLKVIENCC